MRQKLFTRNFTLLIFGQASSLFGNIVLKFALSMYVLELTGSAAVFAGILSIAAIPTIVLSPLGGVLADRANKRNIMVLLDTLTGFSILCAILLLSRGFDLAVIAVLPMVLSVLEAFETPTVQACVPQMHTGDNLIKGNAVVNQVAAVSGLVAPMLGSVLYVAFGIKPVMAISAICFFITAAFECFISLDYLPHHSKMGIVDIIVSDFSESMRFICKQEPSIMKLLALVAVFRFFVMGTAMVGLPYIVRNILGLSATYYGVAESMLAVAAIIGSVAAGLAIAKFKISSLAMLLVAFGLFLIPAGVVFLLPVGVVVKYIINVAAFCGVQIAATVFSVYGLSVIQQKTPNALIGKVMACTVTITICIQPLGQMVYGFLFDSLSSAVYLILIPTGLIVSAMGFLTTGFFKRLKPQ